MIAGTDEIRELDGYEPMGWLLYGDVDHDDVELFMGSEEVTEAFYDGGPEGGFEVTECWVRKVPIRDGEHDGSMQYVYANQPGPGARKCVRVEAHRGWGHWCHRHVYEPASTGFPLEQFTADSIPWPLVINGFIYKCRDCARDHHERVEAARDEHMLDYYERTAREHPDPVQRANNARYAETTRARIAARAATA